MFSAFTKSSPWAIVLTFGLLTSCSDRASEHRSRSADDQALMKAVFPQWRPDRPELPVSAFQGLQPDAARVPTSEATPQLVIRLSDEEVVLITKGAAVSGGHVAQALLSAYQFKARNGYWELARRQDEVAWLGSSGDFGKVSQRPLKRGVVGIFVEAWWSGMGTDTRWLDVLVLDERGLKPGMGSVGLSQSVANTSPVDCDEALQLPVSARRRLKTYEPFAERFGDGFSCMKVTATWRLVSKGPDSYPELWSEQLRVHIEAQELSRPSGEEESGTYEYLLQAKRTASKLVYQFDARQGGFVLKKGQDLIARL